ncbi:MAG TPA: molybdopterin molybdotransferase MoeA [Phycisphaerae bacterium]|nr:molybdopterin molybdotransferase MoeA [Phycisphaerae bacterium]HPU26080.1 molybdopterin molybdotransferase MoeA [Phycisphaerae bacterium]HPZ97456.1 molybdopterin molybdotransferase MoeA [Phycisphaerae bacterium]HQE28547.1 molybdopterin molybdotransferase MoeA [Phycisphaerae bacterium]
MGTATKQHTETPADALVRMLQQLQPVEVETVPASSAWGRVLAEPVRADRDNPPASVSAMDGYAVRLADLNAPTLPVCGEVAIGHEPLVLPAGHALRIFTGGCIPAGCEAVIRREDVRELGSAIELRVSPQAIRPGDNIRYQGENAKAGQQVLAAGRQIDAAVASALAAFGVSRPRVFRRVRVGLLITGDELLPPERQPQPWQLRDSNGWTLQSMLSTVPWIELIRCMRAVDALPAISSSLDQLLSRCDAVFITGGVSMGDHDYVPAAVRDLGCRVVFRKLPIRPGKPLLGAVGPQGQAVLGLPGNPVSVAVTARRFGVPVLRVLAGFSTAEPPRPVVRLNEEDCDAIKLWWYRPVCLDSDGTARCVPNMGSGDLAATARSDGFVEIAPGQSNFDSLPFWPWSI